MPNENGIFWRTICMFLSFEATIPMKRVWCDCIGIREVLRFRVIHMGWSPQTSLAANESVQGGASHLHAVNFPNWYVERSSSACRQNDRLLTEISYIPQRMQGQETTRLEIPLRSTESHQNHSWEESAYTKRRRDARDWQHVLYEDLKQRSFSLARLTRAHSFNCNLSSNCWTCVWLCFTDKIAALFARTTQH